MEKMTYKLDENSKAFSYTREELFTTITKIVEHSSSSESRALAIFTVFEDYLANFTHRGGDGEYYIPECDELDFQDFVRFKLCIDDYDSVNVDEVLKMTNHSQTIPVSPSVFSTKYEFRYTYERAEQTKPLDELAQEHSTDAP